MGGEGVGGCGWSNNEPETSTIFLMKAIIFYKGLNIIDRCSGDMQMRRFSENAAWIEKVDSAYAMLFSDPNFLK